MVEGSLLYNSICLNLSIWRQTHCTSRLHWSWLIPYVRFQNTESIHVSNDPRYWTIPKKGRSIKLWPKFGWMLIQLSTKTGWLLMWRGNGVLVVSLSSNKQKTMSWYWGLYWPPGANLQTSGTCSEGRQQLEFWCCREARELFGCWAEGMSPILTQSSHNQ